MTAMRDIEWEDCLMEPRSSPELEQRWTRETGRPASLMRYLDGSSWMGDATIRLCVELTNRVHLDPDLGDQAGLVVSQDNSCRFCFGAQRMLLRSLGMKESRIARLEHDLLTGDFTPKERAALKLTRRLSRSAPLASDADLTELLEVGISNEEIAELVGLVGVHLYFNRLSTLLALPPGPMEDLPDKWWARLGRPCWPSMPRDAHHRAAHVLDAGTEDGTIRGGCQRARRAANGTAAEVHTGPDVGLPGARAKSGSAHFRHCRPRARLRDLGNRGDSAPRRDRHGP